MAILAVSKFHVAMAPAKSSTGVLDPPLNKQEPPIKCDRRLFSWAFRHQKPILKSSINLREFGQNAATDRDKSTYKVSLSTIFA